jgi:hypothetical protein
MAMVTLPLPIVRCVAMYYGEEKVTILNTEISSASNTGSTIKMGGACYGEGFTRCYCDRIVIITSVHVASNITKSGPCPKYTGMCKMVPSASGFL